jgi:hypothetical protein
MMMREARSFALVERYDKGESGPLGAFWKKQNKNRAETLPRLATLYCIVA